MSRKRPRLDGITDDEKKMIIQTEIKLLKSENRIKKNNSELADCYTIIQDKNEYIRKILDDNFKKRDELIQCKNTIKEKEENVSKLCRNMKLKRGIV